MTKRKKDTRKVLFCWKKSLDIIPRLKDPKIRSLLYHSGRCSLYATVFILTSVFEKFPCGHAIELVKVWSN